MCHFNLDVLLLNSWPHIAVFRLVTPSSLTLLTCFDHNLDWTVDKDISFTICARLQSFKKTRVTTNNRIHSLNTNKLDKPTIKDRGKHSKKGKVMSTLQFQSLLSLSGCF